MLDSLRRVLEAEPGILYAGGRGVDFILLDEAPPVLAYRIFRDGHLLVERDHRALIARKTRAVLDYLDFKPVEDRCAAAVLRAVERVRSVLAELFESLAKAWCHRAGAGDQPCRRRRLPQSGRSSVRRSGLAPRACPG